MGLPLGENVEFLGPFIYTSHFTGVMIARLMMSELGQPTRIEIPLSDEDVEKSEGRIDKKLEEIYEEIEIRRYAQGPPEELRMVLQPGPVRFVERRDYKNDEPVSGAIGIIPVGSTFGYPNPYIRTIGQSVPGEINNFRSALAQVRGSRNFSFFNSQALLLTPRFEPL